MAASLLRLGRLGSLKYLQQGSWGTLRTPFTAAFCSKVAEPKKPAKKAKAASKTLEAPDERASLLAYKTAVSFPTRLSTTGFISQGDAVGANPESDEAAGVTTTEPDCSLHEASTETSISKEVPGEEPVTAPIPEKETVITDSSESKLDSSLDVKSPTPTAIPVETTKPEDQESSSSSSSDSDSDSDSDDEETAKSKAKIEKPETVVHHGDEARKKYMPSTGSQESAGTSEDMPVPNIETASSEKTSTEEIVSPAPATSLKENNLDKQSADKLVSEVFLDQAAAHGVKEASTKISNTTPIVAAESSDLESTPRPVSDHAIEMQPQVKAPVAADEVGTEELVDPAPVITDTAEPASETAVAAEPEVPPAGKLGHFEDPIHRCILL